MNVLPNSAFLKSCNVTSVQTRDCTGYFAGHQNAVPEDAEIIRRLAGHLHSPDCLATNIGNYDGHYAVALTSSATGITCLVADPLGSLPIYYTDTGQGYAWSFLLKNLLPFLTNRALDHRALDEIFSYRLLSEDRTLLQGVKQVPPSHFVYFAAGRSPIIRRYANVEFHPLSEDDNINDVMAHTDGALDAYFQRLRRRHSRIGIFFSGGVDSTILLAKARDHCFDDIVAVTAHFPGHENPEADRAAWVARHLGVRHRLVHIPHRFIAAETGSVVWELERPATFANSIARKKIFRDIADDVSFVLTGEGADRMFGGTDTALKVQAYETQQRPVAWMSPRMRTALASLPLPLDKRTALRLRMYLRRDTLAFAREHGRLRVTQKDGVCDTQLVPLLKGIRKSYSEPFRLRYEPADSRSWFAFFQNRELYTLNRNQFHCYACLARPYGLEVGHPFVSNDLMQIGLTLPDQLKWDARDTKPVLRRLACRYVPEEIVYGRKYGFNTPYHEWLHGPIARWFAILFEERTMARGLFAPDAMRRLKPERDGALIWTAIMLEIFIRQFIDGDGLAVC